MDCQSGRHSSFDAAGDTIATGREVKALKVRHKQPIVSPVLDLSVHLNLKFMGYLEAKFASHLLLHLDALTSTCSRK